MNHSYHSPFPRTWKLAPSGDVTPGLSAARFWPDPSVAILLASSTPTRPRVGPPAGAILSEGLAGRVSTSGRRAQPWRATCAPRRRGQARALTHHLLGVMRRLLLPLSSCVNPRSPEASGSAEWGAKARRGGVSPDSAEPIAAERGPRGVGEEGEWSGGAGEAWAGGMRERKCRAVPGVRAPVPRGAVGGRGLQAAAVRALAGPALRALRALHGAAGPGRRALPARGKAWPCTSQARARSSLYSLPPGLLPARASLPLRPSLPCSPHKQKGCA